MKVGKALYNILGSSKEIQESFPFNTTDYAPSSTELVTNGDFESGSANWTVIENTGGSVTFATNQCQIISNGVLGNGIRQFILTTGKYYKVVIDIASNTNKFQIRLGDQIAVVSGSGVQTFYGVATNTDLLIYRESGEAVDVVLNSVSVKEMVLTKIFPEIAPSKIDAPYIVYSVVSNQPSESKEDNGAIDTASVEVYSFQDTYNKAIDLGVDVRAALKRVNGTYNTIEIQSIDYTNEQMDVNEKRDLWASIQDYEIRIKN